MADWRKPALAVGATMMSLLVGWGSLAGLDTLRRPGRKRPPNDYFLTFTDSRGRAIGEAHGPLRLRMDPFCVYRTAPNQQTDSYQVDRHGFRQTGPGPDTDPASASDLAEDPRPRVFVLGGSLVFGQGLAADHETFVARLDALWPEARVVNAGAVGYLSGQELALLVHEIDAYEPTLVLVVDGWNDLTELWLFRQRRPAPLTCNGAFFLTEDRLVERFLATAGGAPPTHGAAETSSGSASWALSDVERLYRENLERMHAFATARGSGFLVAVQPELGSKRSPTAPEAAALTDWQETYGYDPAFSATYREVAARVVANAQKQGIRAIDLAAEPSFREAEGPLFVDPVHLDARGHALLAEVLARAVATYDLLPIDEPTERTRR